MSAGPPSFYPPPDAPRAGNESLRNVLLIALAGVALVLLLGAALVLSALRNIGGGPLPPLQRPEAHLGGTFALQPGAESTLTVRADVGGTLTQHASSGGIRLELDLQPPTNGVTVGVRQTAPDGAESLVVQAAPLARGEDARWSLDCPAGAHCMRILRISIVLDEGATEAQLDWRLMLQVRIPRGSTQAELEAPTLTLIESN